MCCSFLHYAQTDCKNNVSTNPSNPSNSNLPLLNSERFLNQFDWVNIDPQTMFYSQYETENIDFNGVETEYMWNIMTPSQDYYDYVRDGLDYHPENGWELMLLNLGKYPNGEVISKNVLPYSSILYIILYNRYSGLLRTFINFGPDHTALEGAKSFEIALNFNGDEEVNGLLRLAEGKDRTLDQTSNSTEFKTIVPAPLDASQWAVADFQLMYDPCVCFYPSNLQISIKEILSSTLTMHGSYSKRSAFNYR